jgi:glutaredoxin 3|tara:strand:+ start:1305 stop:1556 length:252 start_codon:yes stop_codon:yes gene_type:complete
MTFLVFSKEGCSSCLKVQQVLQLAEVKHVIYKVNKDFTREEFLKNFGPKSTYPKVILVNENDDKKLIGGCVETVQYLREQKLV